MPALPMKTLHFATWKCLISGPILVFTCLMYKYDWGCTAPCVKKFYNWWAKDAKYEALFSLNVYDFWVLRKGVASLPLTKKNLHLMIWKCYIIQVLFQSKFMFISMILGFACPLAWENFTFNFVALKMFNFRPFLVIIYQCDFEVFMLTFL